jgi:tyrosyl-tRNA synthetase
MFGKIMSISDSAVAKYFELCTYTTMAEVEKIMQKITKGQLHPKEVKMDLAEQIVAIYHGAKKGEEARAYFVETFEKKEVPSNLVPIVVAPKTRLIDALCDGAIVESKTEARRLFLSGAIRARGDEKIEDPHFVITESLVVKVGKHRFVSFVVS